MGLMRLTYATMPRAGTIVGHEPRHGQPEKRFITVDRETRAVPLWYEAGYTMDLRLATHDEVYRLAQGEREPRSIVEYYILRRRWTPYGFAKVWGETPTLRAETIPFNRQIDALKTPRGMSARKAHRKAVEQIREEYRSRIKGAADAWKQRYRDTANDSES